MRNRLLVFFVAILAFSAAPAAAHDIWLQADGYRLDEGATLTVRQLLGDELTSDLSHHGETQELPVLRDMTPRFTLVTESGTIDLLAELPDVRERPDVAPVLERVVDGEGLALIAMDHSLLYTDHTNQQFREYLEHEELDAARLEPLMADEDYQSEGYLRSLKALVRVGDGDGDGDGDGAGDIAARELGQDIEIVLLDNPFTLEPDATLRARVLLHGEPLADQTVKAYVTDGHRIKRHTATTDADGIAGFPAEERGLWLLRLVHLAPCSVRSPVECADATWESYWSAFTFELD